MEAMVSGAVLLIALASVLGAIAAAQRSLGVAEADQHAWQLLRERYELQRAARLTDSDWAVGTRTGTHPLPTEQTPWTWSVVVSQVSDAAVSGVGPLSYRQAVVSLTYRGRTISLEAVRW
jgi:Tfp pilus assembly protein PilV